MAAAEPSAPESPIEAGVRQARALLETRRFAAALDSARALRAQVPENRDVLYLEAVSLRYLGRLEEALAVLSQMERLHPEYPRLFQERGHCQRRLGNVPAAIEAYQRATQLNEALPASWAALEELGRASGRRELAEHAHLMRTHLAGLPPEIVTAASLFADGEIHPAEQRVRHYLQRHGDHIEAMRLLARIGMKLDVLDDAEFLLESVLILAPDYHAARYDYANVLLERHKHAQALEQARRLRTLDPRNRNFRILEANACVGLGDHEVAIGIYQALLADEPVNPAELHLSIAHAHKTLGRQGEAVEAYRRAAAARPDFGDAWWSLANLKTYRFTAEELARMQAQEQGAQTAHIDRYHLCFALGKAYEDAGDYATSFRYYQRGNALKKEETRYRPGILERDVRLQIEVCSRAFFEARRGVGDPAPDPIFIVGMPRAGSTLIEQILASHPAVEGTHELADVPRLVQQLNGRAHIDSPPRYPRLLAELAPTRLAELGARYLDDTRVYRTGRPFFIDKMPNNFRHVGLIHLMLPNARIIDARREPMACCFGNFKQLFASGQEFTYDLEDLARYYRAYVQLMAHWDEVLPGRVLRVQHEELVADLEGQVRRILAYCGLDFDPACLTFWQTARSVRTASSEQVRRPIYREGLDQWRHFEPWLGPLAAALEPAR